MGLDHVRSETSTCAPSSEGSVRRFCSFNAPASRLQRLSFCCKDAGEDRRPLRRAGSA